MSFYHSDPDPNAGLAELREYIRPKEGTPRVLAPNERPAPTPMRQTNFRRRFGVDPRNFIRMASDDPRWNERGQDALDAAWKGELPDDELEALGRAYFEEVDPTLQRKPHKSPEVGSGKAVNVSGWWRNLKMPKATSAAGSASRPGSASQTQAASESPADR